MRLKQRSVAEQHYKELHQMELNCEVRDTEHINFTLFVANLFMITQFDVIGAPGQALREYGPVCVCSGAGNGRARG